MNCIVCEKNNWIEKFNRLGADFVKCDNCGLIRMKTIPTSEEIYNFYVEKSVSGNYSVSYSISEEHSRDYDSVYNQYVDFTKIHSAYPKEQKLLDIGCFVGLFLDRVKQHNFVTYGVEYQSEAAKIANKKHEGRVYCGPIENYTNKLSNFFDVVTLFGVIEHVTEPDKTLQIAAQILKKEGIVIIQTPNTSSAPARVLSKWWPPYAPTEHIYYFSAKNIKTLLERNGFTIVKRINHWKKLPFAYVFKQCENFAPEAYKIFNKIMPIVPNTLLNSKIPFYGGEMLLVAKNLNLK